MIFFALFVCLCVVNVDINVVAVVITFEIAIQHSANLKREWIETICFMIVCPHATHTHTQIHRRLEFTWVHVIFQL